MECVMPILSSPSRIVVEDFDPDDQNVAGKIAEVYNPFIDEVYNAFNKQIDYNNLQRQLVTFEVTTTATGKITPVKFSYALLAINGMTIVNVTNITNSASLLTSSPFAQFTLLSNGLGQITNVTGLAASTRYRITVELM
jgi:hypothetical protein